MNRRLRRLLTGGLLSAAVRLIMGRRKQGIMGQRRNGQQQMGSMFHNFLNTMRKEGWFLSKRRIR